MKKLFAILLCFGLHYANAQEYKTAIGIRGGLFNGITVKHMLSSNTAFEGILSARYGGFRATGLYEFQKSLDTKGLNWYYGFGAHVGSYETNKFDKDLLPGTNELILGADGIVGLEYNFAFPLNLSLDWKPYFNLIGYGKFSSDAFALSARYYF